MWLGDEANAILCTFTSDGGSVNLENSSVDSDIAVFSATSVNADRGSVSVII